MSVSIKNAYLEQVPATATLIYTCPSNTVSRVIKSTITNDTTTADTITFWKVELGGSTGDDRLILNARAIGPKDTDTLPELEGQVLNAGEMIYGQAGTASQLTLSLDVVEQV